MIFAAKTQKTQRNAKKGVQAWKIPLLLKNTFTVSEITGWILNSLGLPEDDANNFYAKCVPILDENGNVNLQNIFIKLQSPGADSTILFVSYYDSVPESPGACDSMLGICSWLEAIRSQSNNANLKTNLYFLFTDAEENGLLGAQAFIAAHPEMKEKIDVVVNIDMGGIKGVVLTDLSSPNSYSIAQMVLRSGARPMMSSLAIALDVAGSDFIAFRDNGYNGIGMSATDGKKYIHGTTDNYQNMNKATAWHGLRIALALTDYAANNSLVYINNSPQRGVFFQLLPGFNILTILTTAYTLASLPCVMALVWAVLQIKNRRFKVSFSVITMGFLMILSIGSAVFFIDGNYLFSIPLLFMTITAFVKKWKIAQYTASAISGIVTLMLWTPVVYYLVFQDIIRFSLL